MSQEDIDEFGKILVQHVRDQSLKEFEVDLRADGESLKAQRWRAALGNLENAESLRVIVRDVVDLTVFSLLNAIDQGFLQLCFSASSGRSTNLCTESIDSLGMSYHGKTGWKTKYSSEPVPMDYDDVDVSNIGDEFKEFDD
jgi:hypothetical protein